MRLPRRSQIGLNASRCEVRAGSARRDLFKTLELRLCRFTRPGALQSERGICCLEQIPSRERSNIARALKGRLMNPATLEDGFGDLQCFAMRGHIVCTNDSRATAKRGDCNDK